MDVMIEYRDEFVITTEKSKLDIDSIHEFLSQKAYWCLNIPRENVEMAIQNSLCFGVFREGRQVGFARVISDYSTIAYLGDVYVLEEYRGKGIAKWLLEVIMKHPNLQKLRRWILITKDAHGLYDQFGWYKIAMPENWMEIHNRNIYEKEDNG